MRMKNRVWSSSFLLLILCFINIGNVKAQDIVEMSHDEFFQIHTQSKSVLIRNLNDIEKWGQSAVNLYYKVNKKKVLSSLDIKLIHRGTVQYIELHENIMKAINSLKWLSDKNIALEFDLEKSSAILRIHKSNRRKVNGSFIQLIINPTDELGITFIESYKMILAAALVLYDNYLHAIVAFEQNKKLRRLINLDHSNPKLRNSLQKLTQSFFEKDNFIRVARLLKIYSQIHKNFENFKKSEENVLQDGDLNRWDDFISQSYTYNQLPEVKKGSVLLSHVDRIAQNIKDVLYYLSYETAHNGSKVFGNSVGMIETRKGKLYQMDAANRQYLSSRLRPLDILLEKTPFRATDSLIPGHWGHMAIWVGSKIDIIQDLGEDFWNGLDQKFKDEIEFKEKRIIEALRPGVQFNTLEHFLNIDDLAVIRMNHPIEIKQARVYLQNAFNQIGKQYDFNFDVETDDRIVCSELAYVAFDDIQWPMKKVARRYTINPDNVASLALSLEQIRHYRDAKDRINLHNENANIFKPVLLYHDGQEIPQDSLEETFLHLLNQDYHFI